MYSEALNLLVQRIDTPLGLVSVGDRSMAGRWQSLGAKARVIVVDDCSFSPHPAPHSLANIELIARLAGDAERTVDLFVAADPALNSPLAPLPEAVRNLPGCERLRTRRRLHVRQAPLGDMLRRQQVTRVDGLRIGGTVATLEVLEGARDTLSTCQLVSVGVSFNPLRTGQSSFGDVDRFLRDHGFQLWRLNDLAHLSQGQLRGGERFRVSAEPGGGHEVDVANGQLFSADATYLRPSATPLSSGRLGSQEAVRGALLAAHAGYWDAAVTILRRADETILIREMLSKLGAEFPRRVPGYFPASAFSSRPPSRALDSLDADLEDGQDCFVWGPYVRLGYGDYVATWHFAMRDFSAPSLEGTLEFEVVQDLVVVAVVRLAGKEGAARLREGGIQAVFSNASSTGQYEFRIRKDVRPSPGVFRFLGLSLKALADRDERPSQDRSTDGLAEQPGND